MWIDKGGGRALLKGHYDWLTQPVEQPVEQKYILHICCLIHLNIHIVTFSVDLLVNAMAIQDCYAFS